MSGLHVPTKQVTQNSGTGDNQWIKSILTFARHDLAIEHFYGQGLNRLNAQLMDVLMYDNFATNILILRGQG